VIERIETKIYGRNINHQGRGGVDAGAGEKNEIYSSERDNSHIAIIEHEANTGTRVYAQGIGGSNLTTVLEMTESDNIVSTSESIGSMGLVGNVRPQGINTYGGDDVLIAGKDLGFSNAQYMGIDTGKGDDVIIVGMGNTYHSVISKDGILRLEAEGYVPTQGELKVEQSSYQNNAGGRIYATTIDMSEGNDQLLVIGSTSNRYGQSIEKSQIDMGAGDDVVDVNGQILSSMVKGGDGFDMLSLHEATVGSDMFSGFEHVDLHSTSHLILNSDDFKSQDIEGGILKISGSSGASVDVQNFDWENLGSANDGNVKYFTYQSTDIPSLTLWIQEGIEVK
ncbi:hypothetical protein E8101_004751, partial [Escherichia coli]|nr:hypothetical protein [Escherichia coli]